MYITGIVAEYNPFHNGHLYQLKLSKKLTHSDFVIAVMSGNFTQRGTPSIVNKFVRTQMALSSGVDMVLELPLPFATASAERFCEASVSLLNKTGIVNILSFGSETANLNLLKDIASLLAHEDNLLSSLIKKYLSNGYSFPLARQAAVLDCFNNNLPSLYCKETVKQTLQNPNNILGIEYIKALMKYNANIEPLTIKRQIAQYHDCNIYDHYASATAIRKHMLSNNLDSIKQCMPLESYSLLKNHTALMPTWDHMNEFLYYRLIFSNKSDLYSLWDIPKELLHSIINYSKNTLSASEMIDQVTSKTYTRATVQRSLLRILFNILDEDMKKLQTLDWIPYIRVLGCKKDASILLSHLHKHAHVPIITNLQSSYQTLNKEGRILLDYELRANAIYQYLVKNTSKYYQDFTHPFIKI